MSKYLLRRAQTGRIFFSQNFYITYIIIKIVPNQKLIKVYVYMLNNEFKYVELYI